MTYLIPSDPVAMIAAVLLGIAVGAFVAWRVWWWQGWGDE